MSEISPSENLFYPRLDALLDPTHQLFKLANGINWNVFCEEFGKLYCPNNGRPGIPIRVVVGLLYLKEMYNESDENVVKKFVENPYWQWFCGFQHFQHKFPCDPTVLTRWRKRVGTDGMEKLLKETIDAAKKVGCLKEQEMKYVNVDTTVQEKAITFPTDAKLYYKALVSLVKTAKSCGIKLRQTYTHNSKRSLIKQGRYAHARQMGRAKREIKKLKVFLGRVIRDLKRKIQSPTEKVLNLLELCESIYHRKKEDKNKIYSLHAPEVECIAKGKSHKKYEFGCKVSIVTTSKKCWVLGVIAVHDNPFDGHTLPAALAQSEKLTGIIPQNVCVDKGYKGSQKLVPHANVMLDGRRKLPPSLKKLIKRRSSIEPVISHLKFDHRMGRNYLLGKEGDKINALLAGCGFNLKKIMRSFSLFLNLFFHALFIQKMSQLKTADCL